LSFTPVLIIFSIPLPFRKHPFFLLFTGHESWEDGEFQTRQNVNNPRDLIERRLGRRTSETIR
jgi:hypothetical protein